jgi:hypothetical protein
MAELTSRANAIASVQRIDIGDKQANNYKIQQIINDAYDRADLFPELVGACEKALQLLDQVGNGKYARTPTGAMLRSVLEKSKELR